MLIRQRQKKSKMMIRAFHLKDFPLSFLKTRNQVYFR